MYQTAIATIEKTIVLVPKVAESSLKFHSIEHKKKKSTEKMSSCGVVSKSDIDILTKQVMIDRKSILHGLVECYHGISITLLPDNLRSEYMQNVEQVNGSHLIDITIQSDDNHPISLDDFDQYFSRLDQIDKELNPTPAPHEPKPLGPAGMQRKASESMKRMGSITDISRSLPKTSSMMNLTMKTFAEPRPPQLFKGASIKSLNVPKVAEIQDTRDYHVSPKLLEKSNAVKGRALKRLAAIDDESSSNAVRLQRIWEKLKVSTDRLSRFMNEFEKIKTLITDADCKNDDGLKCVDGDFLERLSSLVDVSSV